MHRNVKELSCVSFVTPAKQAEAQVLRPISDIYLYVSLSTHISNPKKSVCAFINTSETWKWSTVVCCGQMWLTNGESSPLFTYLPPSLHPLSSSSLGSPNCELPFAWIILQLYRAAVIAPALCRACTHRIRIRIRVWIRVWIRIALTVSHEQRQQWQRRPAIFKVNVAAATPSAS